MRKTVFGALICAAALSAHPMGNFSISHYSKLQVTAQGVEIQYTLDLAELPTFEMLRSWGLEKDAPKQELNARASEQARAWLKNLSVTSNGEKANPVFESAALAIADGAGNLPIMRITTRAHVAAQGGQFTYEDGNYSERAGWKEIVIDAGPGATLRTASQSNRDLSKGLTQYPPDPTIAPPQDLVAKLDWTISAPVAVSKPAPKVAAPQIATVIAQIAQPHMAPLAAAPATMTAQAAPAGAVVKGDFLSRLLHRKELTPWMIFVALMAAFALGAAHALTPGHGKAIVAAYLVGSRGTLKHAAFLGAMVTFTHTITVFGLGLATLFLFRYIVPEKITEWLGIASGLSIVAVGAYMLYKRLRRSKRAKPSVPAHTHAHAHDHTHPHAHVHTHQGHAHAHEHGHAHTHPPAAAGGHDHSHGHHHHGPGGHSHTPGELSWGGLVALGASGGLVPCESALVLLLGAIALGRIGLGLLLLLSFSIGLAAVLMIIGVLVLYAKNLLPENKRSSHHPLIRWASIVSPAVVMLVGLVMTGVSLGWLTPKWLIG